MSYEAILDEFPDLFLAFKEPGNHLATSSYYAFKSVKFPKKTNVWFSTYCIVGMFRRVKVSFLKEKKISWVLFPFFRFAPYQTQARRTVSLLRGATSDHA